MNESFSTIEPVEQLAEEFLARYRRGERPSLSEYTKKHPELADSIREYFPAMVAMEQLGSLDGAASGRGKGTLTGAEKVPPQLGDYRLLRELGRGGMGVVYEAVQETLGRRVALKVLPFHSLLNQTQLERFRREARATARLHHTNIVPVFGVGQHEGIHYYAMQFIQGQGLDEVLREVRRLRTSHKLPASPGGGESHELSTRVAEGLLSGQFSSGVSRQTSVGLDDSPCALPMRAPLPLPSGSGVGDCAALAKTEIGSQAEDQYFRTVAQIGAQVAEALNYAHGEGILHRDVKPSNLLLDTAGRVWVTDFGLAQVDDWEELTNPGDVVGTMRYLAPERFQRRADPQSDVYSLGITLYEMLALKPAFEQSNGARLMRRVAHEEPTRLRKLDRRVPRDLETVVHKACAKEPGQRYATAAALADDLRRFVADRPVQARRTPLRERAWRWCVHNPAVAILATGLVILLMALALGFFAAAVMLREERNTALEKLWDSYLAQAKAEQRSSKPGRRFNSLQALAAAARIRFDPKLRDAVIASLALTDLRTVKQWEAPMRLGYNLAFDADIERYAYCEQSGNINICRVYDNKELMLLEGPRARFGFSYPRFSPDGRFVAAGYWINGAQSFCLVWDLSRGPQALFKAPVERDNSGLAFSPDGRWLALVGPGGSIGLYDLSTHEGRFITGVALPDQLAFHPQGHQIALSSVRDKTAQIVDLQSGRIVATFPHPAATRGVGWSADGQLLAVGCDDLRAYVWNVKARRLQSVLEGHQSAVIHVIFSADLLVTSSWDATSRLWDPVCGRHQLTAEGNALCFNKSGTRLAFLKGTHGGCWEVANGSDCRVLHNCQAGNRTPWPGYAGPRGVDFSPDGRLLASASGDGIRLFEQASGRELAHLSVGFSECALFEPNGASLIGCGESGLERWPIQGLIAGTRELRIGPGQMIPAGISGKFSRASWSADGRTLAVADHGHNQAVLVDLENPGKAIRLGNHSRITSAVVSPSGEWIATGSTRGDEVKVWPAARRGPARSVPTGPHTKSALVAFSPDGQWLVAGGMFEIRFWRVGTWEEGPVISRSENAREGAPMSFSPDGRLLAIARSLQMVQLIDMATIREIGTLTAPDPEPISWLRFSPDGSQLAVATDNNEIRLWNLRSIRFQLAALSLDWDLPPYPPESAGDHTAAPVQVTVETAAPSGQGKERERLEEKELRCKVEELSNALRERPGSAELYVGRSLYYHRLGEFDKDMADLQRALQLDPENYVACANLAWIYVKGPKEFRAPEKALPLAQRAVRLRPENRKLHNTLGVTLYRLGQWDGAIAAFEQAAQVNNGEATAFDLFFLAMSYKNLGKEALARKSLEQAVQWLESNESQLLPHQRAELSAYRAEAEAVLAAEPAQAEAP